MAGRAADRLPGSRARAAGLDVVDWLATGAALVMTVAAATQWYHAPVPRTGLLSDELRALSGATSSLHQWSGAQTVSGVLVVLLGCLCIVRIVCQAPRLRLPTRLGRAPVWSFLVAASAAAALLTVGGFAVRPHYAAAAGGATLTAAVSAGLPATLLAAVALGGLGYAKRPRPAIGRLYVLPERRASGGRRGGEA